jgi:hypothetical protein
VVVATTYGRRLEVQEGVSPKEREKWEKGKWKRKEKD